MNPIFSPCGPYPKDVFLIKPYSFASSYDADAAAWFAGVVAVGSTITDANKAAVNAFVAGCKADGVWTPLEACCLLCAADSLAGALVPLVGPAPTSAGFVAGDYSRTAGLKSSGSTKYLDSNYPHNTDGQNDFHMAAYITEAASNANPVMGVGVNATGVSNMGFNSSTQAAVRCRSASGTGVTIAAYPTGLYSLARAASGNYQLRIAGATSTISVASQTPNTDDIFVFRTSTNANVTNARLSFYSAGTNLTQATLEARIATLMGALT